MNFARLIFAAILLACLFFPTLAGAPRYLVTFGNSSTTIVGQTIVSQRATQAANQGTRTNLPTGSIMIPAVAPSGTPSVASSGGTLPAHVTGNSDDSTNANLEGKKRRGMRAVSAATSRAANKWQDLKELWGKYMDGPWTGANEDIRGYMDLMNRGLDIGCIERGMMCSEACKNSGNPACADVHDEENPSPNSCGDGEVLSAPKPGGAMPSGLNC